MAKNSVMENGWWRYTVKLKMTQTGNSCYFFQFLQFCGNAAFHQEERERHLWKPSFWWQLACSLNTTKHCRSQHFFIKISCVKDQIHLCIISLLPTGYSPAASGGLGWPQKGVARFLPSVMGVGEGLWKQARSHACRLLWLVCPPFLHQMHKIWKHRALGWADPTFHWQMSKVDSHRGAAIFICARRCTLLNLVFGKSIWSEYYPVVAFYLWCVKWQNIIPQGS